MTMNDYVCIGKIVNTHGIKGELRILSDFELKNKVFKKGVNLYVGPEKQEFTITEYRHHKMFDMVINIPDTNVFVSPILSVIPLQLFSYYISKEKGLDVDKPRNK